VKLLSNTAGTFSGNVSIASNDKYHNPYTFAIRGQVLTVSPVYSQRWDGSGNLISSSWVDPNGSDADMYAYENFTLGAAAKIRQITWRGGYAYGAAYGKVNGFTVTFFDTNSTGTEPLVNNPQLPEIYLAKYYVAGNAGEQAVAGTSLYDYKFALPTPFTVQAGHQYWVRIEASQPTYPDWGLATATGGNGHYFRFSTGLAMFQNVPGDTSFTLWA
jgi:hypothetical protein